MTKFRDPHEFARDPEAVKLVQDIAAVYRRWLDNARASNILMMRAHRAGMLDELWQEIRDPRLRLHYFIRARGTGDIKIGKTNSPGVRLKTVATYVARGIDLVACYPSTIDHETELHRDFERHRLNGEWFLGHSDILDYLELLGCNCDLFTNEIKVHRVTRKTRRLDA